MNNDLISRKALLKKVDEMPLYWKYEKAVSYIHDIIKLSPAVDAVEVCRCKDCKHHKNDFYCFYRKDDDFCSWGERREDG